tara:strand:- start:3470 stop:5536 length:2067 start_codon:yes stop_codon:yes gene_type:complete
MLDKEYVVTLHKYEDLEQFYSEMESNNYVLVMKRPISRNTHYMMNVVQADELKLDPRVIDVSLASDVGQIRTHVVNNEPYVVSGEVFKNSVVPTTFSHLWHQWGHVHCAGDQTQRRKTQWGGSTGTEVVTDTVEIYSNGKHVDVVIVDDPMSFDSGEWYSQQTNQSRFIPYQWFNDLNAVVNGGISMPTGVINYGDNASTSQYHGNHVGGTVAGQFYGWAREANIYNLAVTDPWPSGQQTPPLLIFDYLRAFHRVKPVNPETGFKNPTVTNHSYGGARTFSTPSETIEFTDVTQVLYRGVYYDPSNPGPSGWSEAGLIADFGLRFGLEDYPSYSASVQADVEDAIKEGIVIVGSAGNDNLLVAEPNDIDWNNTVIGNGIPSNLYYNRGAWPNSPDSGGISVGALQDDENFKRSTYSNFGPGVDVFAPGDLILSAYGNTGFNDPKYAQGSANFYAAISGTSMASPQVAGIIACQATAKQRYSNQDAVTYIRNTSLVGDMTFDIAGGGFDDPTCRKGSPNSYVRMVNPRPTTGYIFPQLKERSLTGVPYGTLATATGTSYLTYPRVSTFNRPSPGPTGPTVTTYIFTVGNSGASHYTFTGTDSTTSHSNALDPTITCSVGDVLEFNVGASGHPFWIKTSATTGTGNAVAGVINNGQTNATITWDTNGVTPGTYYYICQFHGGMVGQIVIS